MFCLASDWVFRSCYLQTQNSATGPSSKCVSAEKAAVKKTAARDTWRVHQVAPRTDYEGRQPKLPCLRQGREATRPISQAFRVISMHEPQYVFFSFQTQNGTVSTTTPRGLWWSMGQDRQRSGNEHLVGRRKKTAIGVMCFNDLQWAYPTKPRRPPFHAVLGLADAGILPKPHRFEQKMEMDILE